MDLTQFLAMTGAEFTFCPEKPAHISWMACHFSPYGTGLSNMPHALPPGSMLILNDRIPICGHDPRLIATQLHTLVSDLECESVLLDFQRDGSAETAAVVQSVLDALTCPVGVSHLYAESLTCPVFLPPPELDVPLKTHLAPWDGREIWLEAAMEIKQFTLTEKGCTSLPLPYAPPEGKTFRDEALCCTYNCRLTDTAAVFTLWRSEDDLKELLSKSGETGVTRTVGLFQQLKKGPLV